MSESRKLTPIIQESHIVMSPWFAGPFIPIIEPLYFEPPNRATQKEVDFATPESYRCNDDGK